MEDLPPEVESMSTQLILQGTPPTSGQTGLGSGKSPETADESAADMDVPNPETGTDGTAEIPPESAAEEPLPPPPVAVPKAKLLLEAMLKYTELIGFGALEYYPDVELPPPMKPLAPTGSRRWWLGF
jgi:hypothetical protein